MAIREKKVAENIENDISNEILNWSFGKEDYLNIVAPPFSSSKILLETINSYLEQEKKVLYLTSETSNKTEIVELLKGLRGFKKYSYARQERSSYEESLLVVVSIVNLPLIKGDFQLVVYDEMKTFTSYSREVIVRILNENYFDSAKYISFSIESIFKEFKEIIIPIRDNNLPICEPRFLTTRIDLSKEMPSLAFDYMDWSIREGRNTIIYVPKEENIYQVFNYLNTFNVSLKKLVMYDLRKDKTEKVLKNFLKAKSAILVTDDFTKDYSNSKDSDIMVFFADNKVFTYKNLVHFCGKVGRGDKVSRTEVIFLANTISKDMSIAKSITRNFNKKAWRMDLFQY